MLTIRLTKKKLGKLHLKILQILRAYPGGISIDEIRSKLPTSFGPQNELPKRIRELRYQHTIRMVGRKYYYEGARPNPLNNQGVNSKLRASVLNRAHGRCQMCGRTVADDGIRLEVDHKIPHNWGGPPYWRTFGRSAVYATAASATSSNHLMTMK